MATTPKVFVDAPWASANGDAGIPYLPTAQQGPSVFASSPASAAAPSPAPVRMPAETPSVFAAPPAPEVTRQPTPIEQQIGETNQRLRKLQSMDANPYGSADNHPGVGGKILHALSVAGNIAGDIFAPSTMELIPGTQLNRRVQESGLGNRLQALSEEQSEEDARDAATAKTKLETQELPQDAADKHDLTKAQVGNLESEATDRDAAAANPNLATAYAHAVNQAIKEGRDPQADPIVQHLSDAIVALQPGQNKAPEAPKTIQLEINGKPHQMGWNAKSGKYDIDMGESGEKPPTVNVNADEAALDRETKQFGGGHQKSIDAANSQLEKIQDARAMINGNAESQGLGIPKVLTALVGGQGTGVRITQAELQAIAHARGISGDIEGTLNKWSGKGALSKDQQRQLTQIMDDVKTRLIEKQNIEQSALDAINGASTREQIIEADKTARKNLSDFERYGVYSGKQVKLKNGQTLTINHVHADGSFD